MFWKKVNNVDRFNRTDLLREVEQFDKNKTAKNNAFKNKKIKRFFHEPFYNNNNNWSIGVKTLKKGSAKILNLELQGTKYKIENFYTKGLTIKKDINYNSNEDFELKASIKIDKNNENNFVNFVWGGNKNGDYNLFSISNNSFWIRKLINKERRSVTEATKTNVLYLNDYNELVVRKVGNTVRYYLNKELVYTEETSVFFGYSVGWNVPPKSKISINYLTVNYLE